VITLQVCIGSACHLKGSYGVINKLQKVIETKGLEDKITVKAAFCLGQCTTAVSVKVNDESEIYSLSEDRAEAFLDEILVGRE